MSEQIKFNVDILRYLYDIKKIDFAENITTNMLICKIVFDNILPYKKVLLLEINRSIVSGKSIDEIITMICEELNNKTYDEMTYRYLRNTIHEKNLIKGLLEGKK